jgi:hypothetical protein
MINIEIDVRNLRGTYRQQLTIDADARIDVAKYIRDCMECAYDVFVNEDVDVRMILTSGAGLSASIYMSRANCIDITNKMALKYAQAKL